MYGSQTTLSAFLGERLMEILASFEAGSEGDDTSSTVTTAVTQARSAADAEINAAVSRRYPSGFALINTNPTTPELIQHVSNLLTASNLLLKRHAGSEEQKAYRREAEMHLARLAEGTYVIAGAAEIDGDSGAMGVRRSRYVEPAFAGVDERFADRMNRW